MTIKWSDMLDDLARRKVDRHRELLRAGVPAADAAKQAQDEFNIARTAAIKVATEWLVPGVPT